MFTPLRSAAFAILAFAIIFVGQTRVSANGAPPPNFDKLEGCFYLTCEDRSFYILNPEVVTIGHSLYFKGIEAGVANGVRNTDFSGQLIFISLGSVSVIQKVPAESAPGTAQ